MNAVNLLRIISVCGGIGTLKMEGVEIPVHIGDIESGRYPTIQFQGEILQGCVKYGRCGLPEIKKVIFNNPATIVIWADDSKTVVKTQNDEEFDPEKGLTMAITKKAFGNKGCYFDEIKKWTKKREEDSNQ